jgi:EamA domain-containing membrane protein RarD
VAPLIVVVVSIGILGERLSHASQLAVLLIALGIRSLVLTRGAGSIREVRAVLLPLATGGFIAGYTVVDGLGARAAGTPHS